MSDNIRWRLVRWLVGNRAVVLNVNIRRLESGVVFSNTINDKTAFLSPAYRAGMKSSGVIINDAELAIYKEEDGFTTTVSF